MTDDPSIFIVEDSATFRSMAMQVFEGYTKYYASTKKAGVQQFKQMAPDITLLDIGLPDGSGLDLLDEILAYDPEAFIVMLTASHIKSDVDQAKKSGAIGYIIKPCTPKKLLECINRYKRYQKDLQALSSEERAENYLEKIRFSAAEDELSHLDDAVKIQESLDEKVAERLKQWRVIFVDDYMVNRDRAKVGIAKLGCTVDTVEDGEILLKRHQERPYDFIFLDSQLTKKQDGYEISRQIRRYENKQDFEPVCIVAMIEDATEVNDKDWQRAGMNGFVRKPTQLETLRKSLVHYAQLSLEEYVNG